MNEAHELGWFQARSSPYLSLRCLSGQAVSVPLQCTKRVVSLPCDLRRSVTRRWRHLLALPEAVEGCTYSKERTTMEDSRFDELTKALANPTSRRQALKTFAATALA